MYQVIYGIILGLGFLVFFYANRSYEKTSKLVYTGERTSATVIELIPVSDDDGVTYKPRFRFKDVNGKIRNFVSSTSSSPPMYKQGQKVKIVYDIDAPEKAKIFTYWGLHTATILLLCLGSVLFVIGGGYFWFIRS